jgi:hypothetical protein
MSDLKFVIQVEGQEQIERVSKSTKRLETRIRELDKDLKSGRVSSDQFRKGLVEIRRSVDGQFSSWQKARSEIDKYVKSLRAIDKQKSVENATREYKRLAASLDPLEAATQKYESDVRKLDNALKNGVITLDKYEEQVAQVRTQMEMGGVTFNQYGQVASVATRKFKRFGAVGMQQVGYQVGDFAVQLQGGTNAAVAFGQQASQLLGIFGAGGAIAGAGVAIVTAFIAPLLDARKRAKETQDAFENLGQTLNRLDNVRLENLNENIAEGAKSAASEYERVLKLIERVEQRQLNSIIQGEVDAIAKAIVDLDRQRSLISQIGGTFEFEFMGLDSLNEAVFLAARLKELNGDTKEELAGQLRYITESLELRGLMTPEVEKLLAKFAEEIGLIEQINDQQDKFNKGLEKSVETVTILTNIDVAEGFASAADRAGELAKNLRAALTAGIMLKELGSGDKTQLQMPGVGPVGVPGVGNKNLEFGFDDSIWRQVLDLTGGDSVGSSGRSGGSGGSGPDPMGLMKSIMTPSEALQSEYEQRLEQLKQFNDQELALVGGHAEARRRIEEQYSKGIQDIQRQERSTRLTELSGMFGAMASIAETGGQNLLGIQAVVSGAATMIAAYETAQKAAAEATTIPGRIAAYAAFLAQGISTVQKITSIGNTGRASSGGGSSVSIPSGAAATIQQNQTAPQQPQRVLIEGLSTDSLISGQQLSDLFDRLYEENSERGAIFMVAR